MKALIYEKYGSPEVLKLANYPKPIPKGNEVLIAVRAAAINDWDWNLLTGKPYIYRLLSGILKPKNKIMGSDVAGIVAVTGDSVTRFKPGDEVYGDLCECGFGAFAEFVCVPETALINKPETMSFVQAAAIPQAGMLAVQGLCDVGNIKAGQKILINGAGGGVGTLGVQIAKTFGVEVTGVDRTDKLQMMSEIGFDHVIDYTRQDFTKAGVQYDLILDNKTNRSPFAYLRALSPGGMYVTTGGLVTRLLQALLFKGFISMVYKKKIRMVALKPNKDLAYINELFESGKLLPVIEAPHKLETLADAFRYFGEGNHKGKMVVTIEES